jgi:hypothetical protein
MGDRNIIGSLFCFRRNRARNRTAIRMAIRTRVDSPLQCQLDEMQLTFRRLSLQSSSVFGVDEVVTVCYDIVAVFVLCEATRLPGAAQPADDGVPNDIIQVWVAGHGKRAVGNLDASVEDRDLKFRFDM